MGALAKVVKKNNGIFVVHMRDERAGLLESIREVLKIAEESGVRMHISHLKAMGEKNWPLLGKALAILEESQKNGLDITFDVYPYISTGTVLYTLLPTWVSEGGKNKMLSRLKDSALRPKIIKDLKKEGFDYSKIKIAVSPIAKSLAKRNISEIAASQEKTIEDTLLDILIASNGQVVVTMEALSEENLEKTIINPLSIISSNGSGYNLAHAKTGEVVHPRSFGSFPRVLRKYVLEKKIISWEEAIRKMTSFPAERFGIAKRGRIQEEYFADVLIIDPEEIRDFATVENPYQYSRGVETVLVNGKPILQKENHLGARSGVVLKRTGHFQKLLSFLNR
jgi:N-acyl-D-aspartate/D-glutamate deacylase